MSAARVHYDDATKKLATLLPCPGTLTRTLCREQTKGNVRVAPLDKCPAAA